MNAATDAPESPATTDADGRFVLDDVPAGPRTLVISIVGYALARREVAVASAGTLEVTLPLAAGAGAYTEQVTVRAGDEPPRATAPVEFARDGVRARRSCHRRIFGKFGTAAPN